MKVTTTGKAIQMPVGEQIRGRLLNVIGDAIDGLGSVDKSDGYEIHNNLPNLISFQQIPKCYLQESK